MAASSPLDISPQGEPLGEYMARVREARRMNKTELARRAQVHLTTILRLESGQVKGQKLKGLVLARIATALQVPVEYLRAAGSGTAIEMSQSNKICLRCWVPGTSPDSRWGFADAKFCLRCGEGLVSTCACGELVLLRAKFCPECGKGYCGH
ncbi:helix-turn-helix domain-containing protein [Nodosilinea nodulosa]|uniref:helix-turn-helix domain-containing protein n=1 Tax=Nodosilinea nodulosa TaxID=416001 RepID=UPI000373D5FE